MDVEFEFAEVIYAICRGTEYSKKTIKFIKDKIQSGMTLLEVRHLCETKMIELGADSFWYWDVGCCVKRNYRFATVFRG